MRALSARARWCGVFSAFAAVLIAAVAAVSALVLRLERERYRGEVESARQDSIRLALWRLEGLLGPAVATEARRPPGDYDAFVEPADAYTKLLQQIRPGEVLVPSPLMTWRSEAFPLHFQIDEAGAITSPQAPSGNLLDVACVNLLPGEVAGQNRGALDALAARFDVARLKARIAAGEAQLEETARGVGLAAVPAPDPPVTLDAPAQVARTQVEWARRNSQVANNFFNDNTDLTESATATADLGVAPGPAPRAEVGPLIPFFTGDSPDAPGDLVMLRRVVTGERRVLQGVLCNADRIRELLVAQVADLLPGARLAPVIDARPQPGGPGLRIAALPFELIPAPPRAAAVPLVSAERAVLIGLWVAALGGLFAAAVALRTTVVYGEKKSRFASAVTHELRTPLTTFQMYTELLAEDMVPDERKRRSLLETLRTEAIRLSGLVESVLAFARVEDGRRAVRPTAHELDALLDRLEASLDARAEAAGLALRSTREVPPRARVLADPDGLSLILGNLVDNAGKYADGDDRVVEVSARCDGPRVEIDVRDHGPGVPPDESESIFAAFERGARRADDPTPGLGLGLALARGLAREMGGDLALVPTTNGAGATFRVTLRLA